MCRRFCKIAEPAIRKTIYTTNAVEALHRSLRKIIKTRGSFPNDDASLAARATVSASLAPGFVWRLAGNDSVGHHFAPRWQA